MRLLAVFFLLLLASTGVMATHNRAGEITYRQISKSPPIYEFTIVTYTKSSSQANRPELELYYGDGTLDSVKRDTIIKLPDDMQRNEYTAVHTFGGSGVYTISVTDPNRNQGIVNITNSVNVVFYIETMLTISPFLGFNNTPILLNPPVDNANINQIFIHNPNAYDPDGDSLSYRLVNCKQDGGVDIPGYALPSQFPYDPVNNLVSLDAITGDFVWNSPKQTGEYNIAILIEEWRNGVRIGYVLRDMQIDVYPSSNIAPDIAPLPDFCVMAGDTIEFDVTATDPDSHSITLTGTGGPMQVDTLPADFPQPINAINTVSSTFRWVTGCAHIRNQFYEMVFKAEDQGSSKPPWPKLVDMETVLITVVGPPPTNLTAAPIGSSMELNWSPPSCGEATGYRIYRKTGCGTFVPDPCTPGVPASSGYVLVGETNGFLNTTFVDNNGGAGLVPGSNYSYVVVALYDNGTTPGIASEEACQKLKKDIPIITRVDVRSTDVSTGDIYLEWSKPSELDTITFPGPYKYLIYGSDGFFGANLQLLDSTLTLNDTSYIQSFLNTDQLPYSFRVDLYYDAPGNRTLLGSTQIASSVFLSIAAGDNRLQLSWEEHVPWGNPLYVVHKWNGTVFVPLDTVTTPTYVDNGLVNGASYCYKIEALGTYNAQGITSPLINFSEEECGSPIDTVPPCSPLLTITGDCDGASNTLSWTYPTTCEQEVLEYRIYFASSPDEPYSLIGSYPVNGPVDSTFIHGGLTAITGCYAVTALDSFQNESIKTPVCIDSTCTEYVLPNVFTPNGDSYNDYYIPFPYKFVERVDMKIYNRWGQLIFETEDPDIRWNGKIQSSGNPCTEGVYYYICKVYRHSLEGEMLHDTLKGYIQLIGQYKPASK
ncbi:MAG: gliding motility-associated C-terminal domain-containing protein [Flavobacteriales bacterium]|nr:gliding motility-associated C-terminal domain-containing protein [Flavobacteriales bacterium]